MVDILNIYYNKKIDSKFSGLINFVYILTVEFSKNTLKEKLSSSSKYGI